MGSESAFAATLREVGSVLRERCVWLSTIRWQECVDRMRAVHLRAKCRAWLPAPWSSRILGTTIGDLLGAPGAGTLAAAASISTNLASKGCERSCAQRNGGLGLPSCRLSSFTACSAEQSKTLSYSCFIDNLDAADQAIRPEVRYPIAGEAVEAAGWGAQQRTFRYRRGRHGG